MPLLGSSKKRDNNMQAAADMENTTTSGRQHAQPTNQQGLNDHHDRPPGSGMANANAFGQTQASGPGANYDDNSPTGAGQDLNQRAAGNQFSGGQDDPYTAGGAPSGRQGGGGGGGRGTQPAGGNDDGTRPTRSSGQGAGGRSAGPGNPEPATGPMIGSDAHKARGLQKEQELNVIRMQGGELAEAERLEHEALARRERAVAHGADPENSALGAGNSGLAGAGVR